MKAHLLLFATLFLVCAAGAVGATGGGGTYQRTKDGKCLVWNSDPEPSDASSWTGERDGEGYATGDGTLTWYKVRGTFLTGSNIPNNKYKTVISYSGTMVRGKLEGTVTADEKGQKSWAKFVDGRRTGNWTVGEAPTSKPKREAAAKEKVERPKPEVPETKPDVTVDVPAEGPSPAEKAPNETVAKLASKPRSPREMDDSLKSLVGPPPLLRSDRAAEASPEPSSSPVAAATSSPPPATGPRLSEAEVVGLSDAEARTQGYNLLQYQHPQAKYRATDETWSVTYDQKSSADGVDTGKRINVTIDDKTRKATVAK